MCCNIRMPFPANAGYMRENIRCQPSEETSGHSAPVKTHFGDDLMVNEPWCEQKSIRNK